MAASLRQAAAKRHRRLPAPEAWCWWPQVPRVRSGHESNLRPPANTRLLTRNELGTTPLMCAAYYGQKDIAQWLREEKSESERAAAGDAEGLLQHPPIRGG
eukprot:CAMPEP_0183552930 /NCGR_PEP_ID=MMETSP0371-20130417/72146_1 /TAXON_ID=268820 /ORGANISM="Peridinium aciculiferum, Strain PAER-2" /LENGTH=100 /DNA_ID=CAMNT_0025758079 /DNA_START=81 /DNA_END=380 /DNA_ORIENTATION=-